MFNPIKELYAVYEQREERERSRSHYPSGLCAVKKDGSFIGKCRRALYYELTLAPRTDPIEPVALFKMDLGNVVHDFADAVVNKRLLQTGSPPEAFDDAEKSIGREIAVKWEEKGLLYPVSGRLDKRFRWDDKNVATEWKSTYGRGIDGIKRDGPREDAVLQVTAYLRQKVAPVQEYVLSYIAMDSGYVYSFGMTMIPKTGQVKVVFLNSGSETVSPWTWADIKRALATVEEAVEQESLPERDYHAVVREGRLDDRKSHWRCRYCGYRSLCWGLKG